MQFTSFLAVAFLAAGTTFAAPAETSTDMMAAASKWTMTNFKRVCNDADTSCTYTYSINAHNGGNIPKCEYKITGHPASRAKYDNVKCGAYTITSAWDGQFGSNHGFQTLSVKKNNLIIYPSYTDAELKPEKVVRPNKSYTPQTFLS